MDLFEHQAKSLLSRVGIPFAPYFRIDSEAAIERLIQKFDMQKGVVSCQICQEGLIKTLYEPITCFSQEELVSTLQHNLKRFVGQNIQTLVSSPCDVDEACLVTVYVDTAAQEVVVEASCKERSSVLRESILRNRKLYEFQKEGLFSHVRLSLRHREQFFSILDSLVSLFFMVDAKQISLDPLAGIYQGKLMVMNVRMVIDEYALFRQPEMVCFSQENQEKMNDFICQRFEGSIGCLVSGQGLALSTVELLSKYKKKASIVVDIGEEPRLDQFCRALKIILKESSVKLLLIHLFVGLSESEPFVKALVHENLTIPCIIRMEAASLAEAKKTAISSKASLFFTSSLQEMIEKVVEICPS